ncbi:hypothetical protein SLS62_004015 [Diatrype stigma]|uniref:Uncharacterized protein n=1 Tax=Diatrype stigma TaxID=117547 RepID=A0AAN9YTF2_9PEZI
MIAAHGSLRHWLSRTGPLPQPLGGVLGVTIPAAAFSSRVNELVVMRLADERVRTLLSNGGAHALAAGGQVATVTKGDPMLARCAWLLTTGGSL